MLKRSTDSQNNDRPKKKTARKCRSMSGGVFQLQEAASVKIQHSGQDSSGSLGNKWLRVFRKCPCSEQFAPLADSRCSTFLTSGWKHLLVV